MSRIIPGCIHCDIANYVICGRVNLDQMTIIRLDPHETLNKGKFIWKHNVDCCYKCSSMGMIDEGVGRIVGVEISVGADS